MEFPAFFYCRNIKRYQGSGIPVMRRMCVEVIKSIVLNIGLLVILAQILARVKLVKKYIVREKHKTKEYIILIAIFGIISVISTYTGYGVNGAIANTRVIGVMAGGFIGGPIVGIGAAIIGSIHRYIIDINGFTAFACAISTLAEGIISAVTAKYVKKNKYKSSDLFAITFFAELLQMIIILIFAKPYQEAVTLVRVIAVPMVFFNSMGMVLFVSVFNHIFKEMEYEVGSKVNLIFEITKKCLPLLQSGIYNKENCSKISDVILEYSKDLAVIFTDKENIICVKGKTLNCIGLNRFLPGLANEVLTKKKVCIAEQVPEEDVLYKSLEKMVAIGAPLMKYGQPFGCLIIFANKFKISYHSEVQFAEGLSKLFSVQFELSEMEKQQALLQKAEFKALQTQINPHFIFNSLNTISAFCREKPDKARELLIALATYFRNSIQTKDGFVSIYDEMDYVMAYLQLEKARFDERLNIIIDMPEDIDCKMPCLILQPIVENAIKHGAMKKKQGEVKITIKEADKAIKISVMDNGLGIPQNVVHGLKYNTIDNGRIGLINVQKRLCYIYGENNGLDIDTSTNGTIVSITIPKDISNKLEPKNLPAYKNVV
ncbi:two-component system, LytT family, sensor histidine kinase LytS [Anaerocolumna aminovalerica]|jgi:two-component system sensor histidine kinase LytS|uniref:Two-component system, LytT family, sensor histidine kinase LytS n=1 Tax=Anaerocolumna aminovalerica TaxID=1527 RepID=A0A1I5G3Y6_9FIRM|nr:two-component system, LytT family, sensor histidine kinase LytS [Anaerocolumna aminovalerica]